MNLELEQKEYKGKLTLVATPIGNMEDITYRAVRVLGECDVIVCEDTRTTNNLLKFYNIKNTDGANKSLLTFHANSSEREINKIIIFLEEGKHLCYVSDAGTPTISDPGVLLVQKIRERNKNILNKQKEKLEEKKERGDIVEKIYKEENQEKIIKIESIPGASAVTMAYSLSGAVGNNFTFYGFMPHKKGRETMIKSILESDITSIVYESVHRIEKFLEQFEDQEKKLEIKKEYVICRELTKMFEEVFIGNIGECINYYKENQDKIRGEFVIVIK